MNIHFLVIAMARVNRVSIRLGCVRAEIVVSTFIYLSLLELKRSQKSIWGAVDYLSHMPNNTSNTYPTTFIFIK